MFRKSRKWVQKQAALLHTTPEVIEQAERLARRPAAYESLIRAYDYFMAGNPPCCTEAEQIIRQNIEQHCVFERNELVSPKLRKKIAQMDLLSVELALMLLIDANMCGRRNAIASEARHGRSYTGWNVHRKTYAP